MEYDEIDKMHYLENKYNNIQKKYFVLLKKLENPLIKEITDLPEHRIEDVMQKISLLKKGWEWKNK